MICFNLCEHWRRHPGLRQEPRGRPPCAVHWPRTPREGAIIFGSGKKGPSLPRALLSHFATHITGLRVHGSELKCGLWEGRTRGQRHKHPGEVLGSGRSSIGISRTRRAADGDRGPRAAGLRRQRLEEPGLRPSGSPGRAPDRESPSRHGTRPGVQGGSRQASGRRRGNQKGGHFLTGRLPVVGGNPQHLKPTPTFSGSVSTLLHDR